ncbi:hypothetical protein [Caenimonas aquaedulcis]|uniref:DUF2059 domain-containing protein n=1 Tax=Caenimonas aquaedulcis TaxID=2793270 RepID=A0A931H1W4_9BURK|nr:hypothetical protein [Caenimonas aquaedulcis]MBG9387028.1 hypothetical protein [Caenimonas aquaedulcis]
MIQKSLLIGALALASALPSFAQTANASASKKDSIGRILKLQRPGIEGMAHGLIEQPALELLNSAGNAIATRVPKDKQESVAKDIQADARKYVDETSPVVRDRAVALAPSTIGAMLEEKFTEDELKQIVSIIESPVYGKFQAMGDDMQKALIEKVVADTRPTIEPKVRALEASIAKRLGVAPNGAAAPAPAARPSAKPASR